MTKRQLIVSNLWDAGLFMLCAFAFYIFPPAENRWHVLWLCMIFVSAAMAALSMLWRVFSWKYENERARDSIR